MHQEYSGKSVAAGWAGMKEMKDFDLKDIDLEELSKKIGAEVHKFVDLEEMKGLRKDIRENVEKTVEEIRYKTRAGAQFMQKNIEIRWRESSAFPGKDQDTGFSGEEAGRKDRRSGTGQSVPEPKIIDMKQSPSTTVVAKPGGRIASVLMQIFGSLGATAGVFLAGACAVAAAMMSGPPAVAGWVCTGVFTLMSLGSGILAFMGSRKRKLHDCFKKYVRIIRNREVCDVEELARETGSGPQDVRKMLKQMLKNRWFPQGQMDEKETCLILTREAYGHYQNAMEQQELRRREELEQAREEELRLQDPAYRQLKLMLAEGEEYIRRIREINDEIPGEEISRKMYRLEEVCGRIFDHVEKKPEKMSDIRKFMSYYLPTTLKLMEAYLTFENEKVQGENIRAAQLEIEETLDDINMAFEKMYDRLFEEDALDISTDISALSAMLAQEGLLEDDFIINSHATVCGNRHK